MNDRYKNWIVYDDIFYLKIKSNPVSMFES